MAQTIYPLKPNPTEEKIISEFLQKLPDNIDKARKELQEIRRVLGRPTSMWIPKRRDFFGKVCREKSLLDDVQDHHFEAVLFVALRFRWRPEEILALWQIEGLPAFLKEEGENPSTTYQNLSDDVLYGPKSPRKSPRNEEQARAWARSAILWQRWGLDKLTPTVWDPKRQDTRLKGGSKETHDKKFNLGFREEIGNFLPESPFLYLSEKSGPIDIRPKGRNWLFRTQPEYQATMLALQHARYRNQIRRIPLAFDFGRIRVYTRSIFPALLYWHYNSRYEVESHVNKKGKNVAGELEKLASRVVKKARKQKSSQEEFDGDDLYNFFVSNEIPKDMQRKVEQKGLTAEAYVSALRFEYVRQVYEIVFDGFITEQLISPFLIEE